MDALPSPRPRTPRHCTAPDAADTGRASSWRGALLLTVAGVLLTGLSVQAQAQKPTPAAGSSQPAVPSTAAPNPANAATPNPAAPGATAPSATAPAADRGQSPSQSPQTLGSAPAEQSSFPLPGLTRQRVRLASVGVPLSELQRQIEAALGVPLVLSAGAADVVATGEFSGADGMAFLRDLATRLRLDWALGRGAVHLAPQGTARTVVYNAPTVTVAARTAVLAQREAAARGCREAILVGDDGRLLEGAISNLFLVSGGVLVTPADQDHLLAGRTRARILGLAAALGVPCADRVLMRGDLDAADEAFTASSVREILPIVRVDGRPVGDGRPGPVTRRVQAAFRDLVAKALPAAGPPAG